jgi:hypothetical protein
MVRCTRQVNLPALVGRDRMSLPAVSNSPPALPPATTAGPCRPAPEALRVNDPTIKTPLHTLLMVVAIVDGDDPQTRQLLDHIAVEQHQIEVNDRFDRDVSEDVEARAPVLGP